METIYYLRSRNWWRWLSSGGPTSFGRKLGCLEPWMWMLSKNHPQNRSFSMESCHDSAETRVSCMIHWHHMNRLILILTPPPPQTTDTASTATIIITIIIIVIIIIFIIVIVMVILIFVIIIITHHDTIIALIMMTMMLKPIITITVFILTTI